MSNLRIYTLIDLTYLIQMNSNPLLTKCTPQRDFYLWILFDDYLARQLRCFYLPCELCYDAAQSLRATFRNHVLLLPYLEYHIIAEPSLHHPNY